MVGGWRTDDHFMVAPMTSAVAAIARWIGTGLRESAAMVWMTWWPLVLGFTLSGMVQSFLPRDGLRRQLGATTPATVARASLLGVISSSCSYAASAMARALFARGASWTNSLIFMVASTNLVIELGIVLYLLLGWQFLAAQLVGGIIMIVGLALLTGLVYNRRTQTELYEHVIQDAPPPTQPATTTWRERLASRRHYSLAARFTIGDFTMLRKELLAGFLIAGFLSVHVPQAWWSHIFLTNHGWITVVENAVIAPLIAVISFVCSVGNIPLAAALWTHGVAFGGVIAFIFADLVTLPLLFIYRRFYGGSMALRLFGLLWFVMSAGGLVVEALFRSANLIPTTRHTPAMSGHFPLGPTLAANILATAVVVTLLVLARNRDGDAQSARDPICGMNVDVTAPVAVRERNGQTFYFCSIRCAERFDRGEESTPMHEDLNGDAIDPICEMRVDSATALSAVGADGVTHYFCGPGCRRAFLALEATQASAPMHGDVNGDAIDPICEMRVNSAAALSAVTADGETHYFCGEGCRRTYLALHGSPQ